MLQRIIYICQKYFLNLGLVIRLFANKTMFLDPGKIENIYSAMTSPPLRDCVIQHQVYNQKFHMELPTFKTSNTVYSSLYQLYRLDLGFFFSFLIQEKHALNYIWHALLPHLPASQSLINWISIYSQLIHTNMPQKAK